MVGYESLEISKHLLISEKISIKYENLETKAILGFVFVHFLDLGCVKLLQKILNKFQNIQATLCTSKKFKCVNPSHNAY